MCIYTHVRIGYAAATLSTMLFKLHLHANDHLDVKKVI